MTDHAAHLVAPVPQDSAPRPRERSVLATDHPGTVTTGRQVPTSALLAAKAVRAADAARRRKLRATTAPEPGGKAPVD